MIEPVSAKASLRVLLFLKDLGEVKITKFMEGTKERLLLFGKNGEKLVCTPDQLDALHKASLISVSSNKCVLLPTGEKRIKRVKAIIKGDSDGGFQAQHRAEEERKIRVNDTIQTVSVNTNESPLHRLKSRKGPDGKTWIDDSAFQAGERLRMDFTRGQMTPNVTSNWDASLGSGAKISGAGGKVDLSDNAIDARSRMEKALKYVGPELAGVLTDVCCFLKGLESIERDRRWPPRSAKLMLRVGLSLLARHYGTAARNGGRTEMRNWGADGYRPSLEI